MDNLYSTSTRLTFPDYHGQSGYSFTVGMGLPTSMKNLAALEVVNS